MVFRTEENSDKEITLHVNGTLMGANSSQLFHDKLEEICKDKYETITLDLKEVMAINSSSIGKLLLFRKKLKKEERTIQIKGCSDSLYKTFQLIKAEQLINIEK